MEEMRCLHCGDPFDCDHGHRCLNSPWRLSTDDVIKILEDIVDEHEFISFYNRELPETSSICAEIFNRISNPLTDSCLSKGTDQQNLSSPISFSEKSETNGKPSITKGNEDGDKILDADEDCFDLKSYEFITSANQQSVCTEILINFSNPGADSNLLKQMTSGVNQQRDSSQVSFSEKSETYNKPTESDTHAVPGPSRVPFQESKGNLFEEEIESNEQLVVHTNLKPWTCNVCQRAFKKRVYLKRHMPIHDGEKKYKCDRCGKSFLRKVELKNHASTHSGEKPFSCAVCEKRCRRNCDLKRHMLIHKRGKPFKCDFCDKSYEYKTFLEMHVMNHTGKKPFSCDVCGRGFKRKKNFNRHMNYHSGKNFACEICGKIFTEMRYLNKHAQKHTGSKQFKCETCGRKFLYEGSLRNHEKFH